jgi:hypothetical protein
MSDDLSQQIKENASGPRAAKGDSGSMEQHSLSDQIAADRYLNARKAAGGKGLGVKISKMVPPGAG